MTAYHPQPGLEASSQDGSLNVRWNGEKGQELLVRLTIVNGTNLLRLEAIAKTDETSVAYIYRGGLKGFSSDTLPKVVWRDGPNQYRKDDASGGEVGMLNVLRARNRLAIAGGKDGSVAVFPPPHQFFFARELEVNLGYVWHRRDDGKTFSLGVRQGENAEGYNPTWAEKVFSLFNAPPGTQQRMPVYFYLCPDGPDACREAALAFTHGDRYKPLPGYKTLVTHFHTAFTQELLDSARGWACPSSRRLTGRRSGLIGSASRSMRRGRSGSASRPGTRRGTGHSRSQCV
jgi:hypothetical protein